MLRTRVTSRETRSRFSPGGQGAIGMDELDLQRTVDENARRGVKFTLNNAPSTSSEVPNNSAPPPATAPSTTSAPNGQAPVAPPATTTGSQATMLFDRTSLLAAAS